MPLDPKVVAALIGGTAGVVTGLIAGAVSVYVARRSFPFSRIRMKADLEILEKVRQLSLDESKIKNGSKTKSTIDTLFLPRERINLRPEANLEISSIDLSITLTGNIFK